MKTVPAEMLKDLFVCDFETGTLHWIARSPRMFKPVGQRTAEGCANNWNARFAGKQAFTSKTAKGYFQGQIFEEPTYTHRVIWAMYHGKWPEYEIDHIDGKATNNCIRNLRDVPHCVNTKNQKFRNTNTSGVMGVYLRAESLRWVAQIWHKNQCMNLGSFDSKDQATAARNRAEITFGFHKNHGRRMESEGLIP